MGNPDWQKGKSGNPRGRKPGVPNKNTAQIKSAFVEAFEKRGGTKALLKWAESNETEFYRLASKLIPSEIKGELTGPNGGPVEVNATVGISESVKSVIDKITGR